MTWYAWALVASIVISSAMVIVQIGRPREPITPGGAVFILAVNSLIVWAIVALAERCS